MSLAVLADHMASKGRGPDSMLIHMSPREVQGLQALAMAHGGSLTINPETGLPEAGFLDKLLPTILGAGLTFMGVPPNVSAMIVGGIQTVRTGDLGKGIQAGLGAYGGANLTAGMTAAGGATLGAESAAAGLTMTPELAGELMNAGAGESAAAANNALQQQVTDRMAAATPFERLSAGTDAFKNNPMGMAKSLAMPAAMAFGPAILAGADVQNKLPQTVTRPPMIAPYASFGGQFVAGNPFQATPTRGAEGGLMGMDNGGYSPGQLDFTQQSEPVVRMAGGGVPGYAIGGDTKTALDKAYAAGDYSAVQKLVEQNQITAADVTGAYKGFDTSGLAGLGINLYNPAAETLYQKTGSWDAAAKARDDAANAANLATWNAQNKTTADANNAANTAAWNAQNQATWAAQPIQYTDAQIGAYLTANPNVDINQAIKDTRADPAAVNRYIASLTKPFVGSTDTTGGSGTLGIYNRMVAEGVDPTEYYNAAIKNDPKYAGWSKEDIQRGYNLDKGAYALSKQLNGVVSDKDWAKFMDDNKYSINDAAQAFGLSKDEVTRRYNAAKATQVVTCGEGFKLSADGKSCVADKKGAITCGAGYKLSIDGLSCVRDTTVVTEDTTCPSGSHYDSKLKMCVLNTSATQNTTTDVTTATDISTADKSTLPVGVGGAGITTINPNGTITTRPDIPGIGDGFTGMKDVRDTYEAGGGSLGVNKNLFVPKTYKELEDRFKLTGGSKQAMDYLTGKTKYNPVPFTEDGQISKSYAESVMKIPVASSSKMYIFKNGKYEVNPDYAIPTYDKDGKKSLNLTNADVKTFMDKKPSTDAFYTWATTNNLSPEQIALASDRPINEISKLFTGAKDLVGDDGKVDQTKVDAKEEENIKTNWDEAAYLAAHKDVADELKTGKSVSGQPVQFTSGYEHWLRYGKDTGVKPTTKKAAGGGLMNMAMARGGMSQQFDLGGYSDGGRLLRGPGDGVSDSIPATIGNKRPARLADGEFVVPARIVSELGNGSTEAGARKLYAMMDRVQAARRGTVGKGRVAKNSRSEKYLPA